MRILHFVSGSDAAGAPGVACAVARRGREQAVVRAVVAGAPPAGAFSCPVVDLPLAPGSAADHSAEVMVRFERILIERRPDFVLVYGDDALALAATLAAVKAGAAVAAVEAGRRTGDRPAETSRILIDRLASLLFTPTQAADDSLSAEGVPPDRVRRVGPLAADATAAALVVEHLEAERQLAGPGWPWNGRDLNGASVERIIEAQI